MESSATVQPKDKISSNETVMESCHADDEVSREGPHRCDEHDETAVQEITCKSVIRQEHALSTSEPDKPSCEDEVRSKEDSWKSCVKEETVDLGSNNFQTLETTSHISSATRLHEGKSAGIENSNDKDGEKCKEEGTEEKKALEMSSCVDEMNSNEGNISDDRTSREETMSATLKEASERENGVEGDSFPKNANSYEERICFSTRNHKNALPTWPARLRKFRQCLQDAEFLSCIIPSEFFLPPEIRLYRHRSLLNKPSSSPEIRKTGRMTKSATENRTLVKREIVTPETGSPSSLNVHPSKNVEAREKPSDPDRNAKSIRRAKEILFSRKTTDSAVRRSLRQKLVALNAKSKLRNEIRSSRLCAIKKSPSQSVRSNGQEDLTDKGKPSNQKKCCVSNAASQEREPDFPATDSVKDKHSSPTGVPHLQKLCKIYRRYRKKSNFTRKKGEYKSRGQQPKTGGYIKGYEIAGQSDIKNISGERQYFKGKSIEYFKRKVDLPSAPSYASCDVEHSQTSTSSTNSQMVREQKSSKLNFPVKQASAESQSRKKFPMQDPDYVCHLSDTSDSEMYEGSATSPSSRVGSPEIEIDVDLSEACEAVEQDQVFPEAADICHDPPVSPGETGGVQPRKLPIFRKLPNPSSEPVAVFYYNPEATMLRRCSKYHACCQQSATAAGVTKIDSSTQWEDPSVLYNFLKLKSVPGLQREFRNKGWTFPSYAIVRKKGGRYRIKGRSDVRLPNFSAIVTATSDKKIKNAKSRKSVVSTSKPASSEYASTVHSGYSTPYPASSSTSGSQHMQDTSAFNLQTHSPVCAISSLQVVRPAVNNAVPVRSISILKDAILKPPPTSLLIQNSASEKQAAAAQAVTVPVVGPGADMSNYMVSTEVEKSHFIFKDGILWQKVLRDNMFVWAKVNEDKYNIVNYTSPKPPSEPQFPVT